MEFKTSSFKLVLKIEPDPNGGFVARAPEQNIELHAATQEELKAKIRDKFRELTGSHMDFPLPAAGSSGETIHLEKKFTFTKSFGKSSGSGLIGTSPDALSASGATSSVGGAAGFRRFLWILGAAVLAGLLVYSTAASEGLPNASAIAVVAAVAAGMVVAVLASRR